LKWGGVTYLALGVKVAEAFPGDFLENDLVFDACREEAVVTIVVVVLFASFHG